METTVYTRERVIISTEQAEQRVDGEVDPQREGASTGSDRSQEDVGRLFGALSQDELAIRYRVEKRQAAEEEEGYTVSEQK